MATELLAQGRREHRASPQRTIATLWRSALAREYGVAAYLVEEPGGWREVSWAEAGRRVDELANGLLALGIRKGDPVAILGSTRIEWALADFALALVGAIVAPIYPNSSPKDCGYIVEHSEAVAILLEDESQRAKIDEVRSETPRLRHVLSFEDLDDLAETGRAYAAENPEALDGAIAAIDPEDIFTYIYTSGTTGPPKGCMIRHRNYYEMVESVDRLSDLTRRGDVMLLYLPLAHNFGRLMHLLGPHIGFTIAFLSDPLRAGEALPAVRPTVFPSVPRVYEKVHAAVKGQFEAATGIKRRLVEWALAVGYRASAIRKEGGELPRGLDVQLRLADRVVFSKVKERLGGRLRVGISGGAPLATEIAEFFHALDILVLEGYGLTECTTACTVNRMKRYKFGTVGPALPGFELKTAEDGEVLIRSGTIFAGYLKDEAATQQVLTGDGWLRSGDLGEIDADGFLRITDRKKDIIVTAGGKNVAPQNLENALKSAPVVSQALVVGDRRPYIVALITLEGASGSSAEAEREVRRIVDRVNENLSRFEQIKRFAILPRDFSSEEGEVTPTLKLKRRVCEEHFADEIEALYARSD